MTSKEKALELVDKFYFIILHKNQAKQCAKLCMNEMLNMPIEDNYLHEFLQKVKQEINNL